VDQFPEIAGQIQGSGTGVGEDIPGILVGYTQSLITLVPFLKVVHIGRHRFTGHGVGCDVFKAILIAVPLTPLSKAAMPVSNQLMRTGSGDSFNLEGEVDVFEHTVMTVGVQMLHQSHGVLGVAVIADRCNLRYGLHRVRGGMNQNDIHSQFSSVK
jgi:hypothetical protein